MRKYHLGPTVSERPFPGAEFTVRIANDLRKATVFLGEDIGDDEKGRPAIDPRATGFLVIWKSDSALQIPLRSRKPQAFISLRPDTLPRALGPILSFALTKKMVVRMFSKSMKLGGSVILTKRLI